MRIPSNQQPDTTVERGQRTEAGRLAEPTSEQVAASPRLAAQRAVAEGIHNSPRVAAQRERQQALMDGGLPAQLKAGVEALSGMAMDGVRVHYNSARPAQLGAHAYAQGRNIHLGPGQERHLPHEAWHVVQQAQGRVRPTLQAKGMPVNDDAHLEREADRMGELALRQPGTGDALAAPSLQAATVQRVEENDEPPDGEPLDVAHATQVGVQLSLGDKDEVENVLVAGRPKSPFSGTMGDHVTAFGVHVINLRKAMEGKDLDDAYAALHGLVEAMWTLPGIAYVPDADSEWHVRRAQLKDADGWDGAAHVNYKLTQLQWIAALYLEVREGIPLSLVNTRSVTAKSGRGRGEAKLLARLNDYEPEDASARTKKKAKGGKSKAESEPVEVEASEEEKEIALGLFDDDAAALLTFNHEVRNTEGVGRMMPGHANPDTIGATGNEALMKQIASQHVASVFPLAGDKKASLEKAVLARLKEAHARRKAGDGLYWHTQLMVAGGRVLNASRNGHNKGWLNAYAPAGVDDVFTAFQHLVKLIEFVVPDTRKEERDRVLATVTGHVKALEAELDAAVDTAQTADLGEGRELRIALKDYFEAAGNAFDTFYRSFVLQAVTGRTSPEESVAKLVAKPLPQDALATPILKIGLVNASRVAAEALISARPTPVETTAPTAPRDTVPAASTEAAEEETETRNLKRKAEDDSESESENDEAVEVEVENDARTVVDAGTRLAGMNIERRRRVVARLGRKVSNPNLERKQADLRVDAIMDELSSGTGNSFTVGLRLDREGKIAVVSLRGRPPSPFRGTMGAHATAWLVWVNAINRQLTGATLDVAGWRLVEMARRLLNDAAEQTDPVNKAQNGSRRDAARWNPSSLAAWGAKLVSFVKPDKGWTVNGVQSFAQAILTFANQLPGTTRTNKNTDGHGEAEAWKKVKEDYQDPDKRDTALTGPGLFDASANSSVRNRHLWLMKLALGHPVE